MGALELPFVVEKINMPKIKMFSLSRVRNREICLFAYEIVCSISRVSRHIQKIKTTDNINAPMFLKLTTS